MATRVDSSAQAIHRRADTIECWDDDPDLDDLDRIQQPSSPTSFRTGTGHNRRESMSSRRSIASNYDLESPEVLDREHQIPFDDSPAAAIKSAQSAGIPIPENVPSSALVGGTIKRLGPTKRTSKVAMHDDWGEDLEFPAAGGAFTVKKKQFPESLQHIVVGNKSRGTSPVRINLGAVPDANLQLNKFRDTADDESFFTESEDLSKLQVFSSGRQAPLTRPARALLLTPPLSETATRGSPSIDDDFESDFVFPADASLQLGPKAVDRTRAPLVHGLDVGFEDWGDGDSALGSTYGGLRREIDIGDDKRPPATTLISPSFTAMTMESEDDMPLEGLVLPEGMLPDLQAVLERRKQTVDDAPVEIQHPQKTTDDREDDEFFEGLEIGDGEFFDNRKLSLNHNVKQKQGARKPSPVRRTAMSLTFTTNKATMQQQPSSRNHRMGQAHGTLLPALPVLEPVAETEHNPHTVKRNPRNRWSGGPSTTDHRWPGNNSEAYNAHFPPPPIPQTRAERRSGLGAKSPRSLRSTENVPPTTTHAQLVRAKRSMPNIGKVAQSQQKNARPPSRTSTGRPASRNSNGRPPSSGNSVGRPTSSGSRPPSSSGRPPSRTSSGRPPSSNEHSHSSRAKTPRSNMSVKHPAPFIPGGASIKNSHHIAAKSSRQNLDGSADRRARIKARSTPIHSPSSSMASNATKKGGTPNIAPEHLRREAATMGTLTQPTRKRNFGDGTELETFDDLPTSAKVENRFTVTPVARGAPRTTLTKNTHTRDDFAESPKKKQDTTDRQDGVPRFARDTNASRRAREYTQQRLGMLTSPNAERWKSKVATRGHTTPSNRRNPQHKPHLIKPMGNINTLPKETAANGMTYNPRTFRWEGNDKDLKAFENLEHRTPPRPALITKVGQSTGRMGIQVVGGMVFDPSRMCWLKVDEDPDDEGDPFEGLDDLPEDLMSIDARSVSGAQTATNTATNSVVMGGLGSTSAGPARISGGFGEFIVGEEFDVGPEFVRRQREEEDRWRKGTDGWISIDVAAAWENRFMLKRLLLEHQQQP